MILSINRATAILVYVSTLIGCSPDNSQDTGETATGKLSVYTVNYPLEYFAERIGGEHVEVVFPASR